MAVTGLDVRLLGPLEVQRDHRDLDLGSPKQRAVLAVLAIHAGQVVSRARLIGAVWGPNAPSGAAHALQTYVSGLRSVLGTERIERRPNGYVLRLEPGELDVDRLGSAVELASSDPGAIAGAVAAALSLVRGEPLADVAGRLQEPALVDALEERVAAAREALARSCLRDGHAAEAADLVAPVLVSHPLRETAFAVHLRALAAIGRSAEGLGSYDRLRERLRDELGVDPGPELQEVHRALLATSDPPVEARNPFKGLHAFGEDDADDFFGRETLVREVLEVLDRQGVAAVVGPSGIGKSSLLRAGIVAALRRGALPGSERWQVTVHASGSALVEAVGPTGRDEVVVIDHLEELFTQGHTDAEIRRGVRAIVSLADAPSCRLLLALRADQYHEPIRRPELAEVFLSGLVNVLPLRPDELEAAVTGPCSNVGVAVEPALLAELAADLAQHPDALPHLQHTLTELFDARDGRLLRLRDYLGLGGLRGTLERRAESVHDRLGADQQTTLRRLLLALVVPTDHGVERRTVEVADLSVADEPEDVDLIVERLARWRLVVRDRHPLTDEPTLALTHDALLRSWPRLTGWVEGARADLRRRAVLESAAAAWDGAGRPDALLLSAEAVEAHETWAASAPVGLGRRERSLLDASRARADELAEGQARERRRKRRRTVQGAAALAVVVAGIALLLPERPDALAPVSGTPRPRVLAVLEGGPSLYAQSMQEGARQAARTIDVELDVSEALFGQEQAGLADVLREICTSPPDGLVLGSAAFLPFAEDVRDCGGPPMVLADGDPALLSELGWDDTGTVTLKTQEAAYLAGVAAAARSSTGHVAVVAGTPLPPVERFVAGFWAGATDHDPDIEVSVIHISGDAEDLQAAFDNEAGGHEAADRVLDRGADVILVAAGYSVFGVLEAVDDRASPGDPTWIIGADTDLQTLDATDPGARWVLGSVLKRLDQAVVEAVDHLAASHDEPLRLELGLADGAVDFLDTLGRADDSRAARDAARRGIVEGTIVPPEYRYPTELVLDPVGP